MPQSGAIAPGNDYEPRRADEALIYRVVAAELDGFLAESEARGRPLPSFGCRSLSARCPGMVRDRHAEEKFRNSDFEAPGFAKVGYRTTELDDRVDESRTSFRDSSNYRTPELHEARRWQRRYTAGLPITMQTEQP